MLYHAFKQKYMDVVVGPEVILWEKSSKMVKRKLLDENNKNNFHTHFLSSIHFSLLLNFEMCFKQLAPPDTVLANIWALWANNSLAGRLANWTTIKHD
jgi:hypothetical protein